MCRVGTDPTRASSQLDSSRQWKLHFQAPLLPIYWRSITIAREGTLPPLRSTSRTFLSVSWNTIV